MHVLLTAVDWASLAKQWIAQREVMGMTGSDTQYVSQPPPQHVPAAPPPPPPPPPQITEDDSSHQDLPAGGQEDVSMTMTQTHGQWILMFPVCLCFVQCVDI